MDPFLLEKEPETVYCHSRFAMKIVLVHIILLQIYRNIVHKITNFIGENAESDCKTRRKSQKIRRIEDTARRKDGQTENERAYGEEEEEYQFY